MLLKHDGLAKLCDLLKNSDRNIVHGSLRCLIILAQRQNVAQLLTQPILSTVQNLRDNGGNPRTTKLARALLAALDNKPTNESNAAWVEVNMQAVAELQEANAPHVRPSKPTISRATKSPMLVRTVDHTSTRQDSDKLNRTFVSPTPPLSNPIPKPVPVPPKLDLKTPLQPHATNSFDTAPGYPLNPSYYRERRHPSESPIPTMEPRTENKTPNRSGLKSALKRRPEPLPEHDVGAAAQKQEAREAIGGDTTPQKKVRFGTEYNPKPMVHVVNSKLTI